MLLELLAQLIDIILISLIILETIKILISLQL